MINRLIVLWFFVFHSLISTANAQSSDLSINERLKNVDMSQAENAFLQCGICHSVEKDGRAKIGPNLWGIIDQEVASSESYKNYSESLKSLLNDEDRKTWSIENLDQFLSDTQTYAPGNFMGLAGINDAQLRATTIAYLNTFSDSPMKISFNEVTEQAETTSTTGLFGDDWPQDKGHELVGHTCNACHSLAIVKQQRLSRDDWNEVLEWMMEEQGMSELDTSDRDIVLDYLSTNFAVPE